MPDIFDRARSLRNGWTFQYTTTALLAGVKEKIDFHRGRLNFWNEAKKKVLEEAKTTGVRISESLAGQNYTKAGRGIEIEVDDRFQTQINEAEGKVREHHQKVSEYESWKQVFEGADPKRTFELTADDYIFFFGK